MTALPEKDPVTGKYPEPAEGEPVVHANAGAPKADGAVRVATVNVLSLIHISEPTRRS